MKRTTTVISISAMLLFASVLAIGNSVAFTYGGQIDTFLQSNNIDGTGNVQDALVTGKELAQKVTLEGSVLLKNQNNTLPLSSDITNINIFGWGGCDNGFMYQGGGSSEGGYTADRISLYDAFRGYFYINEDLATAYNSLPYRREGGPDQNNHSLYYRTYEPGQDFYDQYLADAVNFSDTAVVVLSRRATEGDDLPKVSYDENGVADETRTYLSLTAKEELMMEKVTENFENVIVLINSSAPMEMGFLEDSNIDAAFYIGYPGFYGAASIPELLLGTSTPSGHLTDTAAYSIKSAPSYVNSGPDATITYTGQPTGRYKDYAEDIYVGYKWYETADEEGFFADETRDEYGQTKTGYDAVVQYPFGYGLSYTTFNWVNTNLTVTDEDGSSHSVPAVVNQDGKEITDLSDININDTLTFNIWVENTGSYPGKEVVQLYVHTPYYKGEIEKASQVLVGFAKTVSLDPGQGQLLSIDVKVTDLASYDTYDKNNNGFMGYELDRGDYTFSFRTDSHHVKVGEDGKNLEYTFRVPESGYKVENDPVTGTKVENLFTNYTNPTSGASSTIKEPLVKYGLSIDGNDPSPDYNQGVTYLSRADFKGTYPERTATRSASMSFYQNVYKVSSPTDSNMVNPDDVMPEYAKDDSYTPVTLDDVKGLPYDDPKWDELISSLTIDEMTRLCANGGFSTQAITRIKKGYCNDSDGGTGFTNGVSGDGKMHATKYPAANVLGSTWDYRCAYEWGTAIGKEGQAINKQGWYAPGCNVHRSPLGGRNFEYFAEDGYMCGMFVAYTVKGCTENGVYAYMKHFAANDTDEGRNGQFIWMTEQSLREIWAKPGEIATKVGGANAMMVSVDRIGATRATGSHALLTGLLRDEWGFRGSCITDYYQSGDVNDLDEGIRAGNDIALKPGDNVAQAFDENWNNPSATAVIALQKSAKNILYTYIDTIYRTENATGIDMNVILGNRENNTSGKWWRPTLIAIDSVLGVGMLGGAGTMVYFTWFKKKRKEA